MIYNLFIGKYKREVSAQTIYTAALYLHTSVAQGTTTNATRKMSVLCTIPRITYAIYKFHALVLLEFFLLVNGKLTMGKVIMFVVEFYF